jgi:hypothetical protein
VTWPGIAVRVLVAAGLVLLAVDWLQWATKRGPYRWRP